MESEPKSATNQSSQRELAAQARAELERPEPDWLCIKELAERGAELSGAAASPAPRAGADVDAARVRSLAALEQVRPVVAEADDLVGEDNMARAYLDHAQQAFDGAAAAPTTEAAIEGFRLAEESANAAHEHALALRAQTGRKVQVKKSASPFWGVFSRSTSPE